MEEKKFKTTNRPTNFLGRPTSVCRKALAGKAKAGINPLAGVRGVCR